MHQQNEKSQSRFFGLKTTVMSISVTVVFFHFVSKVSAAIVEMDIFKNVRKKVATINEPTNISSISIHGFLTIFETVYGLIISAIH
jgi:hypothetical protein